MTTFVPQGEYPQNPLPTIFVEQVGQPQQAQAQGGLVISKGVIAMISLLVVGMLVAGTLIFYTLWKKVDERAASLDKELKLVKAANVELTAKNAQTEARLSKYLPLESLLDTSKVKRAEIEKLLAQKPNYPGKDKLKLDAPLWRESTEKALTDHVSNLDKISTAIINWSPGPKVVRERIKQGAIKTTP